MKKILLLSISMICLLASCGNTPATTSSSKKPTTTSIKPDPSVFDEDHIILKAPVLSDEHCERKDPINSSKQTENSIKKFLTLTGQDTFDIWLSGGDRSLTGTTTADGEWYSAMYAGSKDVYGKTFFVHGNHDVYWTGCATRQQHYDYMNTLHCYDLDLADSQPAKGNRHAVVNGIHFFTLDVETFMPNSNTINATTISWFKGIMENVETNKPVFVLTHSPALNTCYGSRVDQSTGVWGASQSIRTLLNDYPNVICLSGHTHYDIHDERNIWQGEFTSINIPTLAGGLDVDDYFNGINEAKHTGTGTNKVYEKSGLISQFGESGDPKYNSSAALYLEIDQNYNTRITRYDLQYNKVIKSPWIIAAPKADKSHLTKYTDRNRSRANEDPEFSGNFGVTSFSGKVTVNFDAFKDDDMVYAYDVQIFDGVTSFSNIEDEDYPGKDGCPTGARKVFFADWWKEDQPSSYKVELPGTHSGEYAVRVIAIDSFGGYSIKK